MLADSLWVDDSASTRDWARDEWNGALRWPREEPSSATRWPSKRQEAGPNPNEPTFALPWDQSSHKSLWRSRIIEFCRRLSGLLLAQATDSIRVTFCSRCGGPTLPGQNSNELRVGTHELAGKYRASTRLRATKCGRLLFTFVPGTGGSCRQRRRWQVRHCGDSCQSGCPGCARPPFTSDPSIDSSGM